jgi:hypothetical protein
MDLNGTIQRQLEEDDRSWAEIEEPRQSSGRRDTQKWCRHLYLRFFRFAPFAPRRFISEQFRL